MSRLQTSEPPYEAAYFTNPSWRFPEQRASPPHTSNVSSVKGIPKDPETRCSAAPRAQLKSSPYSQHASPELRDSSVPPTTVKVSGNGVSSQSPPIEVLDEEDDLDDHMDEDEFDIWIAQQYQEETRRLSTNNDIKPVARRKSSIIPRRNPPITHPHQSLSEYFHNGIRLTPNSFVELRDEDFMKIVHIVSDSTQAEVTLRGFIFRRTREMNGLLNRLLNEVCWILHVDEDDSRDPLTQGVETRAVSEVIRRRAIRLTNRPFPELSFREDSKDTQEVVMSQRVLVCRFKYLCFYANAKARMAYTWSEKGLHRLREEECDKRADNDVKDEDLRRVWRGETVPGGMREGWLTGEKEFLRQEALSHRGIASHQSLKAVTGPDFPPEDIMKRCGVGAILDEEDLFGSDRTSDTSSVRSATPTANFSRCTGQAARGLPLPHRSNGQREGDVQRCSSLTHKASATKAKDYRMSELNDKSDLSRNPDRASTQPSAVRETDPQVVEINANVKTTSSLGIYHKHYQGRITSSYTPNLQSKIKRSSDGLSDLSPRPAKKPHLQEQILSDQPRPSEWGNLFTDTKTHTGPPDNGQFPSHSDSEDSIVDLSLPSRVRDSGLDEYGFEMPFLPPDRERVRTFANPKNSPSRAMQSHRPKSDNIGNNEDDIIDLTLPLSIDTLHPLSAFEQSSLPSAGDMTFGSKALNSSLETSAYGPSYHMSHPNLSQKLTAVHVMKDEFPAKTIDGPFDRSSSNFLPSRAKGKAPVQVMPISSQKKEMGTTTKSFSQSKVRRYTFGDCFCGAGGMSRGAINAGLRIDWGFDFNLAACQTYAMNFFGTPVYNVAADQFADGDECIKVDICHLSPPCQFFSDAHTIQGKDDDMNTASLFAIFNLLQKTKPRVVTLEQTSGLIRRHPLFFNAVINMFTSKGFSVRWRVRNCADYGLPQRRMRLFIIASWYVHSTSYNFYLSPPLPSQQNSVSPLYPH